jgi:hypothetical protein
MTAESVAGGTWLVASSAGILAMGAMGPLNLPFGQLASVSMIAALGVLGRAFFDANAARSDARKAGVPKDQLPQIDFMSLGYALVGAPLVGNVAYGIIRYLAVPDYGTLPAIMLMGYLGNDGINYVLSTVKSLIKTRFGNGGDK